MTSPTAIDNVTFVPYRDKRTEVGFRDKRTFNPFRDKRTYVPREGLNKGALMAEKKLPAKDPESAEEYYIVWCSPDGTNDGGATDIGELQGRTISTSVWTVQTGLTKDEDSKTTKTIRTVVYAADTITTIKLSSGAKQTTYKLTNKVTLSDGEVRRKTIYVTVDDN